MTKKIRMTPTIEPGLKMSIKINGVEEKYMCLSVGELKNKAIVMQMPYVPQEGRKLFFDRMITDNTITVHFAFEGEIYGFESRLIKYVSSPFPIFFVTYPDFVESISLRKHKRVPCLFQGVFQGKTLTSSCVITDISLGGCLLYLSGSATKNAHIEYADRFYIECGHLGWESDNRVKAIARRISISNDKMEIGSEFSTLVSGQKNAIENILTAYDF